MKAINLFHEFSYYKTAIISAGVLVVLQTTIALGSAFQVDPSAGFPARQENNLPSSDKDNNPHESLHKFKKYFKEKYQHVDTDITSSDVKRTKHGLSGSLWISGNIVPQKKPSIDMTKEPDRHARARAIAKAFMEDEAALFGITNPDEVRELNISTNNMPRGDYTFINFQRYINNIELENADMQIVIGPTEDITTAQARLVAVPPEVYEATKKKTLPKNEVQSIVEKDLTENMIDTKEIQITCKKMAILSNPYVVWEVISHWVYTINAFTGEIIRKVPNWKD